MRQRAAFYLLSLLLFSLASFCGAFVETRGCNRTVRNSIGWIRWTGRMGRCIVHIMAPSRDPQTQVIELRIRRLQVGFLKETKCEGAYIQFFDGGEDVQNKTGRYCGHVNSNATRLFLRKGPNLTIIMDSDVEFATENPVIFSAQFSILPAQLAAERHRGFFPSFSFDCPVECVVRNDQRFCKLMSPGYPGVYPRGIRCRIALESNSGRFKIGGQPTDVFDLMNHTSQDNCQTENCERHIEIVPEAPRTRVAKSIGRYLPGYISYRRPRSPDHEEELEFIIGQTSHKFKRNRNNRRKLRKDKKKVAGSKDLYKSRRRYVAEDRRNGHRPKEITEQSSAVTFLGFKKDPKLFVGYHDEETSTDYVQRRLHRPQQINKKSMDSISSWRNFDSDLQDISGESVSPDGTQEIFRKDSAQEKIITVQASEYGYTRRGRAKDKLGSTSCVGDYLALLENVDGKIFEISKFCGEGHVPRIITRGKNIIVEFYAQQDGTIMHDGFQLSVQETEQASGMKHSQNCDFVYKSSERTRENIKSLPNWYPPDTICSYKFIGRTSEKISVYMKIIRNELDPEYSPQIRNLSLGYCSGNEIAVYNGIEANNNILMWSYCDVSHQDINNIQVPLTSSGNELLIQYYSAKGSYDGQEFTYTISYRFLKKSKNSTNRRQIQDDFKLISLRPVNFSALNLNDSEYCNCDFGDRIGSFKNWFMVLVVLGIISFLGAIFTIITLLVKCMKIRSMEKRLLQTPKL